ncbi:MAG: glycosyltransferase family 10 [Microscillaceae bacterium]|nr:glycosyltransferase family 10 [Microscillaceae bacterium]
MITVKLTYPQHWLKEDLPGNYLAQSPHEQGIWENYQFEINQPKLKNCDFWVVNGNLDTKETVKVNYATIFISSEERTSKIWDDKFLQQFDWIVSSQEGIRHPQVIRTQYICPWQVRKTYNELIPQKSLPKPKDFSAVVSDMVATESHKKRFAFVNQLKGHFKDRLDWFGKGNVYIRDKWDGLSPYKYSIAFENTSSLHYWTEKIADCYLALCMPIYWGCPNIADYFPEESMILLKPNDLQASIQAIEQAMEENRYEQNFDYILKAKDLVMNAYNIFPKLKAVLDDIRPGISPNPKSVTLKPEYFFTREPLLKKVIRKIRQQW